MTQPKVWIIGNRGMLGTELSELFASRGISFTGTDREVDITNQDALNAFAAEYKPFKFFKRQIFDVIPR